jgi:hypothetical protein
VAQVNENRGDVARFTFRTIASIVGLIGAIIALVIDILYSLTHLLGRVAGVTDDPTHFWWGLFVILVGTVGAFLAPILPILSAIMLLGAGIAFFFIVGWWAAIASPFFIVAALMTFSNRRVNVPGVA